MKLTIEIHAKNMALIHTCQIECDCVPRVGESLSLPADVVVSTQGLTSALVYEVEWDLKKQTLEAIVRCQAWKDEPSLRVESLVAHGWLQAAR